MSSNEEANVVEEKFDPSLLFTGDNMKVIYPKDSPEGVDFGDQQLSDLEFARLAMAMDGSNINVSFERIAIADQPTPLPSICLKARNAQYLMKPIERHLYRLLDDSFAISVISNDNFQLKPEWRKHGIAKYALALQVKQALDLNFSKIVANVAGSRDSRFTGYCVWPLLGFDGKIPEDIWAKLPPDELQSFGLNPANPERISRLYELGGGNLWKEFGEGFMMELDLDPNSPVIMKLLETIERRGE